MKGIELYEDVAISKIGVAFDGELLIMHNTEKIDLSVCETRKSVLISCEEYPIMLVFIESIKMIEYVNGNSHSTVDFHYDSVTKQ